MHTTNKQICRSSQKNKIFEGRTLAGVGQQSGRATVRQQDLV